MNRSDSILYMENPVVRVLIMNSSPEVTIATKSPWRITNLDGIEIIALPQNVETTLTCEGGIIVLQNNGRSYKAAGFIFNSIEQHGTLQIRTTSSGEGHTYEGCIEVYPGGKGMPEIIVSLPMEEYLKGVVPYEIGPDSPQEAMCAQAVAARSEAYVGLLTRKYAGDHYDMTSDVSSQVFRGNERRSKGSDEAVRLTRGHVLMFEGQPCSAYYASTCGGHTEDIRNVWKDRAGERAYWGAASFDGDVNVSLDLTLEEDFRKWLDMSPAVYCNPEKYTTPAWSHKNFRWTREVSAEKVSEWISPVKNIGRVIALRPLKRGVSGRLIELEFVGDKGSVIVSPELKIRRIFSPALRSSAFVINTQGPTERPDMFIIRGTGSGHGVGMCQVGAIGMAHTGKSFREILKHYYPNMEVNVLY